MATGTQRELDLMVKFESDALFWTLEDFTARILRPAIAEALGPFRLWWWLWRHDVEPDTKQKWAMEGYDNMVCKAAIRPYGARIQIEVPVFNRIKAMA